MNQKEKIQEKLFQLKIKHDILNKNVIAARQNFDETERKQNLILKILSAQICKLEEDLLFEQSNIEEQYSTEKIEEAKSILEKYGYTVVRLK